MTNELTEDVDPTRIALELDPEYMRMAGTAYHGNTPFDVPYVSRITDDLWQGGCADGMVLPRQVRHLVSLYPWESYDVHRRLDSSLTVTMYDQSGEVDSEQVLSIARWVNECRRTGLTLVHCQAGLNRSGLVAATALVLEGRTPREAIDLLRETRSPAVLCNRDFEEWVRRLGR